MKIIIAGGGIAGLSMALTCHQLGLNATVYEAAPALRALGVGINLQPNAVRELYDLDLAQALSRCGVQAQEWALFSHGGMPVWSEPRGLAAGYHWPQFSIHRGQLQMLLYDALHQRSGSGAVQTDATLTSYEHLGGSPGADSTGVRAHFRSSNGRRFSVSGDVLIAADGIHSAARAQMYPEEGTPRWGGAIMWRGTSLGVPPRTENSFVLIGGMRQRFVCYPITQPHPDTGKATINWIAELTYDTSEAPSQPNGERYDISDWNKQVNADKFIDAFSDWQFGWLDAAELINDSAGIYEYPMVDRDPLPSWVDGRCVLIGDAAHPMYPVGSNGASQAIVDTRNLGAALQQHHADPQRALLHYDEGHREPINALVLRNRSAGPIGILGVVEERTPTAGVQNINEIVPKSEIEAFMSDYKRAAGFAIDSLNQAPPTIRVG